MAIPAKNVLGNPNVTEGSFQIAIEQLRESVIGSGKVYDSANTYMAYDICEYSGVIYYSKIDNNIGNTPLVGANWGDYADLILGVVHKTGNETIAGVKTFSDNVGIGVTPSPWFGSFKVIDIGKASFYQYNNNYVGMAQNCFFDGSNYKYKANGKAYDFSGGLSDGFMWKIAPDGIAGNNITWNNPMTLGSNGNLLVGTTTDNGVDKLQVNGRIGIYGSQLNLWGNDTLFETVNRGSSPREFKWYVGAGGSAPVASLTTSGVWTSASDKRNKVNIKNIHYGLDTIMSLSAKEYDLKSDGTHGIGFIAQEVKNIIPELVFGDEDKSYLTLDYASMVAVLTKAVQEQQAQIEELKVLIKGKQNGN